MQRRIKAFLTRCMNFTVISVVLLCLQLFSEGTAQCINTGISKLFGEISYLPIYTAVYERRTCSWQFKPPSTDEFILIIKLHYVVSYNQNDIITLPDWGTCTLLQVELKASLVNMSNQGSSHSIAKDYEPLLMSIFTKLRDNLSLLFEGKTPFICMKYVMYTSESSYDCLQKIKNLHCPEVDLKLINLPIRLSVVSIPEHAPWSELVYYTNFQLTYLFAFCTKSGTGENQTNEVHDVILQFENEQNHHEVIEKHKEVLYNQNGEIVDSLGQVVEPKPENKNYDSTPTVLFIVFVILSVIVITTLYFKIRKHKDTLFSLLNFFPRPTSFDNIADQGRNQNATASRLDRKKKCCRVDNKYSSNERCEGRAEEMYSSAVFSEAPENSALYETLRIPSTIENETSELNSSIPEKGTHTIETTSEEVCKSSTGHLSAFSASNASSSLISDAYITSNEDRFENAAESVVRRDEELLRAVSHEPLVIPCQTKRVICHSSSIKKVISIENIPDKNVKKEQNTESSMEGFNCEPLDLSICAKKK